MRTWILVVVIALAACGKDKAAGGPAVVPGAAAGDVVEVVGIVTAKRDAKMRQLAVGDEVSGDDVIATAADASVVIQLRHNGVRWSLQGGQDKRLADAAAWKAAARGDGTASLGERTTAAGRHAEREAAETGASAERMAAPEEVAQAPAPAPAPAMAETSRGLIAPAAPSPGAPAAPSPGAPAAPRSLMIGFQVEGEVAFEELSAAIADHRDTVLGCTSGLGHLPVKFTVTNDGKVADVELQPGTLEADAACVTAVFAGLQLPAHATPTAVLAMINAE